MSPRSINLLLFLFLLALQSQKCLGLCPQGQTSVTQNGQQTCIAQAVISANIRPSPTTFVYLLVFEGGAVPFTSLSDFNSNTVITVSSTSQTLSTDPQTFISVALNDDLTVIQIVLLLDEAPYGTTMTVSFTDFSTTDSRVSYIKGPVSLAISPMWELTSSTVDLLDVITDVDYIVELVWIVISLLSPYWILYMDCKLYRETLNMFKQLSVQYEPFLTTFYQVNDRKVAGARVPNLFGIFLLGNDFASEWTKYPQTNINSNRVEDFKVLVDPQLFKYNSFALFLDNFGVQLTLIVAFIIIVIICESLFKLLKLKDSQSLSAKIFRKIKQISRSFLLMTAVGSCQSLVFYAGIQLTAVLSERTTNNIISFAITAALIIIVIVCAIIYIVWTLKKNKRYQILPFEFSSPEPKTKSLGFFRPILSFYKDGKLIYPFFILLFIARAITFAVFTIALISYPVAQVSVMLFITIGFIVSLIVFRPYEKIIYTIFKVAFEFVLFLALALLLALSVQDSNNSFSLDQREWIGRLFLGLWIAVPVITILFGTIGLIQYAKQFHTKRKITKKNKKVVPAMERKETKEMKVLVLERKATDRSDKTKETNGKLQKTMSNIDDSSASPSMSYIPYDAKKETPLNTGRTNLSESEAQLMADRSQGALFSPPGTSKQNGDMTRIFDVQPEDQQTSASSRNAKLINRLRTISVGEKPQVPAKSIFGKLSEVPKQKSEKTIVRKRNFEALELKLTPQSMRIIDDKGFKAHVDVQGAEEME